MKKISVLMAALTAVTVGGVYAAWTYAESNLTNIQSGEQVINVAGIDTTTTLKAGSFNIEASDDLHFVIDSAAALGLTGETRYTTPIKLDDGSTYADYYVVGTSLAEYSATGTYHQHEAVLLVRGDITVTFTPAQQASEDIQTKGLATNVYFTNPSAITIENIKWEDQGILKFNSLSHKLGEATDSDGVEWTKTTESGQTVFTYKYTAAELAKMLTLKQNIVLDTSAKHGTFSDKLDGLTVKLHVDQATPTAEN